MLIVLPGSFLEILSSKVIVLQIGKRGKEQEKNVSDLKVSDLFTLLELDERESTEWTRFFGMLHLLDQTGQITKANELLRGHLER